MNTAKLRSSTARHAVVSTDDDARAMLDYAASSEGSAKIERAREEIRDGNRIVVDAAYFDTLNDRISRRASRDPGM